MPSSFSSTAHGPSAATASATDPDEDASIGCTGRPTTSPNPDRASSPPASTAAATSSSDPLSITARRTPATGTPDARATASTATASSAPCRTSPVTSPYRNRCSASVAAPQSPSTSRRRPACDPAPFTAASSVNAASTCPTVSEARCAGATGSRSTRHPTPSRPCGSRPDRYAITTGSSAGSVRANSSASSSVFRDRDDVAATRADTSASSSSTMPPIVGPPRPARTRVPARNSPERTRHRTVRPLPEWPALRTRARLILRNRDAEDT